MDLSTRYLGMTLRTPLVPSASPFSEKLDNIKRMEDAGASAVVLHSLFEEQLMPRPAEMYQRIMWQAGLGAAARINGPLEFRLNPDSYLKLIWQAKAAVRIPVIASLSGMSLGGWTGYARAMQAAGADAVELNLFYIPTDIDMTSEQVEQNYVDIVKAVKTVVSIPVAVKLGPYLSNVAHMAKQLAAAGADGLVLFNRFYQPDIDLSTREVRPHILLSTPQAMRLPLHWISMLYKRVRVDLAASSGVHSGGDALKLVMAGANVTMLCSALLRHGIDHLRVVEAELVEWMERFEYESLCEVQGTFSLRDAPDPTAFERDQYIRALQGYRAKE